MELDQLKTQWRKEMNTIQRLDEAMFSDLQNQVSLLNKFSLYEDLRDVSLWLFVALLFSFHWLIAENVIWLERLGLVIILATCLFISYTTLKVRARYHTEDWTIAAKVANEISRIENKSRLLMQTASWYLLPLYVGLLLVPISRLLNKTSAYHLDAAHGYYFLFCVFMGFVGYWWSRRVIKQRYTPVLSKLKDLREELAQSHLNRR